MAEKIVLKKVGDKTAKLIKEKVLPQKSITLPITEENLEMIFNWFEEEEISLANDESDGVSVDRDYFNAICKAVDELLETADEEVDIIDLNQKLSAL